MQIQHNNLVKLLTSTFDAIHRCLKVDFSCIEILCTDLDNTFHIFSVCEK